MSGASDPAALTRGTLRYFPVLAGRLEFAAAVRRAILQERPEVVAVELPVSLEEAYLAAVQRLPELTVLVYPDEDREDGAVFVPVEPCDPFTRRFDRPGRLAPKWFFVEPDLGLKPHITDVAPDPYSAACWDMTAMWRHIACILARARTGSAHMPPASRGSCRAPIRWRAPWLCFR
jgi:hypothetical protein